MKNKLFIEIYDCVESIEMLQNELKVKFEELRQQLNIWQEEKGMSGRELAKKLEISPQYLNDIKRGRRYFSKNILNKIQDL